MGFQNLHHAGDSQRSSFVDLFPDVSSALKPKHFQKARESKQDKTDLHFTVEVN
jgi:hypothetical protein